MKSTAAKCGRTGLKTLKMKDVQEAANLQPPQKVEETPKDLQLCCVNQMMIGCRVSTAQVCS